MVDGINDNLGLGRIGSSATKAITGLGGAGSAGGAGSVGGASFADMLKQNINEVVRLQQDASTAVENLATGKTQDVTGVMTAMEKSDLAFKTLLSIRAKLMQAYDEIKNIPV